VSSSTSSVTSSLLRLNGLSSGLDTESIVKSLLQIDQLKVDKEFKLKTKLEWTGDAYRAVNLEIKNFREKYMSVLNPSSNMFSSSAYSSYKVTMGSSTGAVSVSAGAAATADTHTIKVNHLATAGKASGTGMFTGDTLGTGSTLSEAFGEGTFDEDGNISFSINGETFSFSKNTTISSMMSTINSNADANVTMSYSSLKKGFTITSRSTGASGGGVVIENLSGSAFAESADSAAFKIAAGTYNGEDAEVVIDDVTVKKSSNTFTIDGLTYTLKSTTSDAADFTVERDTDATYQKISDFVDAYNTLIADLQSKVDEEVYKDYEPLTDTEREQLSDSQAEKWDEKAKSGLLNDDGGIRSLLTNLRNAFYTAVSGAGKSAADIGLQTAAYGTTGKIVIDETKLKNALETNPDAVAKIFTNVSSAADSSTKYKESGLVTRMSDILNSYVNTTTNVTLAQNSTDITDATNKLDELNDWLSNNEEKYYAKFTAMETALAKLNSQSSWISSMLGSSSSS